MGTCASKEASGGAAADRPAAVASPPNPSPTAPPPLVGAPAGAPANRAKRGAVGEAEPELSEADTVESLPKLAKSEAEASLIRSAVADNVLFRELQEQELLELLVGAMAPLTAAPGTAVVTQGDAKGDAFYVIQSGTCEVLVDGGVVATRGPGAAFGELALLYACPRSATVRVAGAQPASLWVLQQRHYRIVARSAHALRTQNKVALLSKSDFFPANNVSADSLLKIAEMLESAEFAPGDRIFSAGDEGDTFYLLLSGRVQLSVKGKQAVTLEGAGKHFGERSLLSGGGGGPDDVLDTRWSDVTVDPAGPPATFYTLRRQAYQAVMAMQEEAFRVEALLKGCPQLAPLRHDAILAAANGMELVRLQPGEELFAPGQRVDGITLLVDGALAAGWGDDGPAWGRAGAAPLPPGFAFGGDALAAAEGEEARYPGAVRVPEDAAGATTLLRLTSARWMALFEANLAELVTRTRVAALSRVPILKSLSADALRALSAGTSSLSVAASEAVVRSGEAGDAFYLIEAGSLAVLDGDGREVARLCEGGYFGELALLTNEKRRATVVVRGCERASLLVMTRASFEAMREANPEVAAGLAAASESYAPLAYAGNRVQLTDVSLKKALGVGTFGKVWLAVHKEAPYALKQIAKAQVVKKGLVAHVKRERDVMKECAATPFVVRLEASFQDAQNLYLLMEIVPGGELFYYLQSLTAPLSEPHARFYAACVVEAFSFLHARYYLYRDLKPENLLLCANGYIKVADFSFVKRLRGGKTHTLCGTPAYLAPEQIQRQGHDRAVDWWALGVLLYELLAGISPFYHDDDMMMYKRIVDCKYTFQPPVCPKMSFEAKDLINGLLQKAPHQRLPMSRRGVAEITEHKFFKGFSWEAFRECKMRAPYLPRLKGSDDLRYFPDVSADENPGAEYGPYTSVGNFSGF